ncbi:amidohydrolase [Clostridiales bacterium]|nr:amidohydrolase [Clostridiales bacterium]
MMKKKQLLVHGGNIITMDENNIVEAVAVEEGTIIETGNMEQCRQSLTGGFEEIDLKGKTMLPGFIDPHVHFLYTGMLTSWADLTYPNCKSIGDMIRILKEYAKTLPEDVVICGYGFDQRKLLEERYPTTKDLDQVAADRKVKIMHISGHGIGVNSYYMQTMGIDKNTPDVDGGVIFRDQEGNLEGMFFDSAADHLVGENEVRIGNHGINCHAYYPMEMYLEYIKKAQDMALAAGLTSINEVQVTRYEMSAYQEARKKGLLKSRLVSTYYSCYFDELKDLGMWPRIGDDKFMLNGLKLYADGSLLSGTTFLKQGYKPWIKTAGHFFHKPQELMDLIKDANAHGFQTLTHVTGNVAIDYIIQAVREARAEHPEIHLRHRIEHCGLATEEQVAQMNELDIWPIPQPMHFHLYGKGVVQAVGETGEDYNPYGWFKKHNVPIVISSDSPVSTPDVFTSIYTAVTRKTADNEVIGPHQKISIEDALMGCTLNAAKAMHMEDKVGSLECGKKADFLIVSDDPLTCDVEKIKDIEILETWIDGKVEYTKGENYGKQ